MIQLVIFSSVRSWLRYRKAIRELSHLNDRELSDIGLSRGDIDRVARQGH